MRVLFVAPPMVGHVLPLVPLAVALHEAGHDVLVATGDPQLLTPGPGDRTVDARHVERRGAGLARPAPAITAMPHPRQLVEPLADLAEVRRR